MKTIFKYDLDWRGELEIPSDNLFLHFAIDPKDGQFKAWFELDTKSEPILWKYSIVPTGGLVDKSWHFLQTHVADDGLVWHLYRECN